MDARYLSPGRYVDSDHHAVRAFADLTVGERTSDLDRAIALFYAVRDEIRYDPYRVDLRPEAMRASAALERGYGFCIPKAALLAAAARVVGIPSRLGFADVKNHLATQKLLDLMDTDLFVYHGFAELWIDGRWIKATPAFNATLCARFDVEPLEFDGRADAMLQQANRRGDRYMEYIADRGVHADVPLQAIISSFAEHYPRLMRGGLYTVPGDFEDDAAHEPGPLDA